MLFGKTYVRSPTHFLRATTWRSNMSRLGLEIARPLLYGFSLFGWWDGNNSPSTSGGDIDRAQSLYSKPNSSDNATDNKKPTPDREYILGLKLPQNVRNDSFGDAIKKSSSKVDQLMIKQGIPGLVVGVSRGGQKVWSQAFGYCDVENMNLCQSDSIMRIASISKSLTMATVVAKLVEEKKLNLDSSIHDYLEEIEFPKQKFNGTTYDIKLRHLLSNTSGIRHYHKDSLASNLVPIGSPNGTKAYLCQSEIDKTGHYQQKKYTNVLDSLELFKNDDLVCEPGTKYKYSTYGWVLVSAIVQKVLKKDERFEEHLMSMLRRDLGMKNTFLDQEEPIIFNRTKYYKRNGYNGQLMNAPYVDISCKWAGGGLLSNTDDLLRLANMLIHSFKGRKNAFLKTETVHSMWNPVIRIGENDQEYYGLGFKVGCSNGEEPIESSNQKKHYVYHTGSAVGASSILIILPEEEVVVAIIVNLSDISLRELGFYILNEFKHGVNPTES